MNPKLLNQLCKKLKVMPSQVAWNEEIFLEYQLVLTHLDDEIGQVLLKYLLVEHTDNFRPATSILMAVASHYASPLPLASEVYRELKELAVQYGENCKVHPDNPNVTLPGTPTFSSPIVAEIVERLGGWGDVCKWSRFDGNTSLSSIVYMKLSELAQEWYSAVRKQLLLPAEQRDRKYFPQKQEVPILPERKLPVIISATQSKSLVPMPETTRKAIEALKTTRRE